MGKGNSHLLIAYFMPGFSRTFTYIISFNPLSNPMRVGGGVPIFQIKKWRLR